MYNSFNTSSARCMNWFILVLSTTTSEVDTRLADVVRADAVRPCPRWTESTTGGGDSVLSAPY